MAGDLLDAEDALGARHVGQGRPRNAIPNGAVPRNVGAVEVVHDDLAPVGGDADLLEADALQIGDHADGAQHDVRIEHFLALGGLDGDLGAGSGCIHSGHLAGGHDVDAGLLEAPGELLGDLLVFDGDDVGHVFHDGHIGSDGIVEVGELHTDGAGSDDHHLLGLLGEGHGFAVADDLFAVLGQVGQHAAAGSRRDDDVLGLDHLLAAVLCGDLNLAAGQELAIAHDDVDLVLLHQELHPLGHAVGNATGTVDHATEIDLGLGHLDAVILGVLDVFEHVGALEQRLGGDASPIQADAAQGFTFDDGGLQTELGGADGGYITTGAAAEYHDIVLHAG